MSNLRCGARRALIWCIISMMGLAVSVAVTAEEGGFPLAFATLGGVQTGSGEPSAVGVVTTLYHLALADGYTDDQMEVFLDLIGRLIDDGVPPGTILHVSKGLLSDPSAPDLVTALERLGELILVDGVPPGQAANQLLERGNGNSGDIAGGGNGNGNSGGIAGGGNGNGNTGDIAGGGNGNGNSGGIAGGGNGNGNSGDIAGGGNGNGNSGSNAGGNGKKK
jgi:hypothetical protein